MAIKWGPGTNTGSGWLFYAGIEFSLSYPGGALDSTDTYVTVTTRARLRSNASTASGTNADYSFTGDQTGSGTGVSWSLKFAGDQELIATRTQNVTLTSSTQSFDVTVGIQPSKGALGTGWCYVTGSVTIPARPVASPAAPTGLYVSRVSDVAQTGSWTNKDTTSAPYDNIEVWRSIDGGSFTRATTIDGSNKSSGFTTTKNRCLDLLRHKTVVRKGAEKLMDEHNMELQMKLQSLEAFDNKIFSEPDIESVVQKAIDTLPKKCREIFVMNKIEGKKQKAIAAELNISVHTVESQMSIAHRKLKEALKEYTPLLLFLLV